MNTRHAALALTLASSLLSGCVAAAVPALAASAIGGKAVFGGDHQPNETIAPPVAPQAQPAAVTAPRAPTPQPIQPVAMQVPQTMQFLYGSGEAAALSLQAYEGLIDMMVARSSDRAVGLQVFSVVLSPDSTLAAPKFLPCGSKPLAVMLDIDETSLLNLGYEEQDAAHPGPFDPARWDRWEKTGAKAVVAAPGLLQAANAARESSVTLIYNSNRLVENAAETAAALSGAGLGPIAHLKNLWLQGDVAPGPGKDPRRWAIAQQYCVIAMVGDQLGDFSDLFNAPDMTPQRRRNAVAAKGFRTLWGHGWFILPNPVYGTSLKGGFDDVFPADKRWIDPGPAAQPVPTPAP